MPFFIGWLPSHEAEAQDVFLAGLAVTVPFGVTIYILIFMIDLMDGPLRVMPAAIHPETLLGFRIPGLGVIATVILIFIAGKRASPPARCPSRRPSSSSSRAA